MKRRYESGFQKRKKNKLKNEISKKQEGSLLNFLTSTSNTEAEAEENETERQDKEETAIDYQEKNRR